LNRLNRILVPVVCLSLWLQLQVAAKRKAASPEETAPHRRRSRAHRANHRDAGVVSAGDQVQLSWRTTGRHHVSIDGIGDVPTSGVKTVTPTDRPPITWWPG
jgi:peptidoglycan-associated lipoprotein